MDLNFFGEDLNFWIAMGLAMLVKFLFSTHTDLKIAFAGIISGGMFAYWGSDFLISKIEALTFDDKIIVAIGLTLTGEHIARWLVALTPSEIAALWRRK